MTGDSHVSDIISVYEQKLRGQKTRENHLDDLVQAKTMALAQADRLIQQYKSRLAQVDSEVGLLSIKYLLSVVIGVVSIFMMEYFIDFVFCFCFIWLGALHVPLIALS